MNIGALTATLGVNTAGLIAARQDMQKFEQSANRSLRSVNARLRATGETMKKVGRSMTMFLTVPIVGLGVASAKMFTQFESSMSKIIGLVGIAQKQVQEWGGDIIRLAPQLGKAPKELADALFFVTSAGIRGAAAMDVLEVSAKASAAGLGETKIVADLVTSAMNAYGPSVLSAEKATNILVATVREGKAEADALASSMGMVLPISSALEVSFDQVGAAIASMTRTGTNASTASIQLRQILASILKPTDQAREAMKDMGTSAEGLRKSLREDGLIATLSLLKESVGKNDVALAKIFPNIRALSGVLDIVGANMADNVKIFDSLTDATDALNRAFEAATNTVQFKWDTAMSAGRTALTEIGRAVTSVMLPTIKKLAEKLIQLTEWFQGLTERQQRLIIKIAGLVAAIGPLVLIVGTLTVAVTALNVAMAANPIGIIIVGVAALVGAITLAWQESVKFRAVVKAVALSVAGFFKRAFVEIKFNAIILWQKIKGYFKAIGESAGLIWETIKIAFRDGIEAARTFIQEGMLKIVDNISSAGQEARMQMEKELSEIKTPTYQEILAKEKAIQAAKNVGAAAGEAFSTSMDAAMRSNALAKDTLFSTAGSNEIKIPLAKIDQSKLPESLKKMYEDLRLLNIEMVEFGGNTENAARQQEIMKSAIIQAIADGTDPLGDSIRRAKDEYKSLGEVVIQEMEAIQKAQMLVNAEQEVFQEKLNASKNISLEFGKAMGKVLSGQEVSWKGLVRIVLDSIAQILAALLAQWIIGLYAQDSSKAGTAGMITASIAAAAALGIYEGVVSAAGLASGGVIPEGFPNDSYPAWLSSGETVLPAPKPLPTSTSQGTGLSGKVKFIIEQDQLVGILDQYNEQRNNF